MEIVIYFRAILIKAGIADLKIERIFDAIIE